MNEGEEFSTHLIVNTLPFFFLPLLLCKGAKNKREGVWASFHFCYLYLEGWKKALLERERTRGDSR